MTVPVSVPASFGQDNMFKFLSDRNITIVSAYTDMRRGYSGLLSLSRAFNIDPEEGNDAVIFVGRSRRVAKIIWSDRRNGYCMCCYPHQHALKQLFTMSSDPFGLVRITAAQLSTYMSGAPLFKTAGRLLGG